MQGYFMPEQAAVVQVPLSDVTAIKQKTFSLTAKDIAL